MPLSDIELAYAAGIVDGEGCIRVNIQNKTCHVIRVQVTNTKKELIDRFQEWFGGYVTLNQQNKYNPNAKNSFVWEVSAKQAEKVLVQVLPFLYLKQEQARLALQLQATKSYTRNSPETKQLREEIFKKITQLNQKGVVSISHS